MKLLYKVSVSRWSLNTDTDKYEWELCEAKGHQIRRPVGDHRTDKGAIHLQDLLDHFFKWDGKEDIKAVMSVSEWQGENLFECTIDNKSGTIICDSLKQVTEEQQIEDALIKVLDSYCTGKGD